MTKQIYLINDLLKSAEGEKTILFSSYAKNTPTVISDIDIFNR